MLEDAGHGPDKGGACPGPDTGSSGNKIPAAREFAGLPWCLSPPWHAAVHALGKAFCCGAGDGIAGISDGLRFELQWA